MKRVSILGATGSVGQSTIDIVRRHPDRFTVDALTAASNVDSLAEAARATGARIAVVADEAKLEALRAALDGSGCAVAAGQSAMNDAARGDCDIVMASIVGCAGLEPTMAAIEASKTIALANKESMVAAGSLMTAAARASGSTILPVDSEHNAIFQCLQGENCDAVERLILTASGGPFRSWSKERIAAATPAEAVAHPNWSMGAKISVDSASMMNKGLELIEAHHLFGLPSNAIDIVVHPQSVIHSMVEYVDGSVIAQMGSPDMRIPIAHALAYPDRVATGAQRLDFAALKELTFEAPDSERFPALRLAREALEVGGSAPVVLNAANEMAVEAFLGGRIGFASISQLAERALERNNAPAPQTVADVIAIDAAVRQACRDTLLLEVA